MDVVFNGRSCTCSVLVGVPSRGVGDVGVRYVRPEFGVWGVVVRECQWGLHTTTEGVRYPCRLESHNGLGKKYQGWKSEELNDRTRSSAGPREKVTFPPLPGGCFVCP
jgi:hypothetical protein